MKYNLSSNGILDPSNEIEEIFIKFYLKGIDISTKLLLEWLVNLIALILGTFGIQLLKGL